MSYYKTIDGKKMDANLLEQTSALTKGTGDGRISVTDAETLLFHVKDGNIYTEVEKDTIDYIFKNYKWTSGAMEWFRNELQIWQAPNKPIPMSLIDLSKKHFYSSDVITDEAERAARKHALEAATNETSQDHDEIGLWVRLKDGTTVEVFSNFIELENDFVQLRGGCIVPVRAIEKVEI